MDGKVDAILVNCDQPHPLRESRQVAVSRDRMPLLGRVVHALQQPEDNANKANRSSTLEPRTEWHDLTQNTGAVSLTTSISYLQCREISA